MAWRSSISRLPCSHDYAQLGDTVCSSQEKLANNLVFLSVQLFIMSAIAYDRHTVLRKRFLQHHSTQTVARRLFIAFLCTLPLPMLYISYDFFAWITSGVWPSHCICIPHVVYPVWLVSNAFESSYNTCNRISVLESSFSCYVLSSLSVIRSLSGNCTALSKNSMLGSGANDTMVSQIVKEEFLQNVLA